MANSIPQLAWMADPDGHIFWFNDRWVDYTGLSSDHLAGWGWQQVHDESVLPKVLERWKHSIATGEPFEMVFPLRHRSGKFRQFLTRVIPLKNDRNEVTRWFGTNTDIHSENAIAADLALKSDVIENSLNGFDIVDHNRRFVYANKSYLRMWGYESLEDMLPSSPADHCADPEVPGRMIAALKATGQCDIEFVARRKDGSTFDVRMLAFLAKDAEGNEIYPTTSIDITEKNRAADHFRELVDTSPAMIWITDVKSMCTYLSQRWYDYTGRTPQQDLGVGWLENIHPEDLPNTAEVYTKAVSARGPLRCDYRLRAKDGTYRWMIDLGYPRLGPNGEFLGYIGTVTDIHDRVLAEMKLNEATERFSRSAKASGLGVWYCDLPFDSLQWSDEVKSHFFLPSETNVNIDMFFERIHPDDRARTKEAIELSIANRAHYDVHYRTTDPKDPSQIKWIRAIGWTDYGANGEAKRFDGITLDATEEFRRNEELMRARDEAEKANRLKSSFLANMSHEIRTPLGAMIGFADLLREPGISEIERKNYLDILTRNGSQLSLIINDILDLSKVEAGHLMLDYVESRPDQIAAEVISLMRVKAKEKDLALELVTGESTPALFVTDPLRLKQILLNLVGNAIKFTPTGSVKLKVSSTAHSLTKNPMLSFEIEDTGIGIDPEQIQNIFQMFVQADGSMTRRFGGTGLGLSLSRRLARELGGDVEVTWTQVGRGSHFKLTVPDRPERLTIHSPRKTSSTFTDPEENVLAGMRILVVDDSPDNQSLIWLYLRKYGAALDSAENGYEGLKKALGGNFDLILMDLQMPLMDGYTATQRLREQGYRNPIIALTAHAMNEVRAKCLQVGCNDHLPKPINPRELIGTLAKYAGKS